MQTFIDYTTIALYAMLPFIVGAALFLAMDDWSFRLITQ